jgi:hypothetical protein
LLRSLDVDERAFASSEGDGVFISGEAVKRWGLLAGEYVEMLFTGQLTSTPRVFSTKETIEPIYPERLVLDLEFDPDATGVSS